jgi:hypothetical protein
VAGQTKTDTVANSSPPYENLTFLFRGDSSTFLRQPRSLSEEMFNVSAPGDVKDGHAGFAVYRNAARGNSRLAEKVWRSTATLCNANTVLRMTATKARLALSPSRLFLA